MTAMITAADVRRDAISGRSLLASLGFLLLLAAFTVTGVLTFLYSTTFFGPLSLAGFEFYHQAATDPDSMGNWLKNFVSTWPSRRGEPLPPPIHWLTYGIIALLLLVVGSLDFRRRKNRTSLLRDPVAEPMIRQLLTSFGYFRDVIMVKDGDESRTASRRMLEVPPSAVIRIRQGRSSSNEQRMLRFVMAHEYAHVVMWDNLANSLFRLLFFWTAGVAMAYVTPLVFATTLLVMPIGLDIYMLLVAGVLATGLVGSMLLSMYSVVISHVKSREFFADLAAFPTLADGEEFYPQEGATGPLAGPGSWSRDITAYERRRHREGSSVAARNLFPGAGVFFLIQHALFMIVAPAGMWSFVLVYDSIVILAVALLWIGLPPHPEGGREVSLLPLSLAFLAALGLWLSTAGLLGYLMLTFGIQPASVEFGLLLSWPPIIGMVTFALGAVRVLLRRRRQDRQARRILRGNTWRRVGGLVLATPATLLRVMLLVFWLVTAAAMLDGVTRELLAGRWFSLTALVAAPGSVVFLLLCALFYRNLVKMTWISVSLDLVLGGLVLASFAMLLGISIIDIGAVPAGQTVDAGTVLASWLKATPQQLAPALVGGAILGLLYVGFGLLQLWARRKPRGSTT